MHSPGVARSDDEPRGGRHHRTVPCSVCCGRPQGVRRAEEEAADVHLPDGPLPAQHGPRQGEAASGGCLAPAVGSGAERSGDARLRPLVGEGYYAGEGVHVDS